ncbi:MAG: S8 family serine peptidase [Bacteroidia bacterium]
MTTLRYGNGRLTLNKSSRYVGVKMRKGTSLPTTRSLDGPKIAGKLGGFELVEAVATRSIDGPSTDSMLDNLRQNEHVIQGTNVYETEGSTEPVVPTGELYVVFRPWASAAEQQTCLDELHLTTVETRGPGAFVVRLSADSPNPISCAIKLQEHALVAIAEPDLAMQMEFSVMLPSDPLFELQWHLQNTGVDFRDTPSAVFGESKEGADAKVVAAWKELGNLGSSAITMAIIDNGFDLDHPDFDGSHRVVHPWDYVSNSPDMDRAPSDTHGTLCAGVALAGTNGAGIVGVAPNCRFMPIRNKELSDIMIELIFNRVIDLGADVVSCSWGRPGMSLDGQSMIDVPLSTRQREAVVKATREGRDGRGCVILFAAGNNNRPISDFCRLPEVIAVGASTSMDERADYSNFGPNLSILGPSGGRVPVITTAVTDEHSTSRGIASAVQFHSGGEDLSYAGIPSDYKGFAGTSCSCPVVAGVCALMLSANPDLASSEVKQILEQTANKIGDGYDERGHSDLMGYGRVNALEAVLEAKRRRRTPARPAITGPIAIQHELHGKIYNQDDYRIFHLNLDTGLDIKITPGAGVDAEFELDLKRGSRPETIIDHESRDKYSVDNCADHLALDKIKKEDYYLIVRPVHGAGDFKVTISLK